MNTRNIARIVIGTLLILLVPLVAMFFTDDVDWNWFDFVVIGSLLLGAGFLYELLASVVDARYRIAIAMVFAAAVVLIWAELAVGIFGSPIAGS